MGACCSAPFLHSCTVQDSNRREWRRPQWVSLPASINVIKTPPDIPRGHPDLDRQDDGSKHHVTGEQVQRSRALTALPEDLIASVPKDCCPLLAAEDTACMQCRDIHSGKNTRTHKILQKSKITVASNLHFSLLPDYRCNVTGHLTLLPPCRLSSFSNRESKKYSSSPKFFLSDIFVQKMRKATNTLVLEQSPQNSYS